MNLLLVEWCSRAHAQGNQLVPVLGVFQKLAASFTFDHEGFYLLEALVEHIPPYVLLVASVPAQLRVRRAALAPYMKEVFVICFQRLSKHKTAKFVRHFLVFLCIYIGKQGPSTVIQLIDSLQVLFFYFAVPVME